MNKWSQNQRWEWALQWQAVPDGSSFQGKAETWRVWDGAHWQNIKVQQTLSASAWHTLDLYGTIVNGQVHYQTFRCDNRVVNLQIFKSSNLQQYSGNLPFSVVCSAYQINLFHCFAWNKNRLISIWYL